ncbi:TPA: AAA family ATPase [Pseudomonas aeruginosa]|uniref:ATP-binding protein n=1 Tax=Pseudomonas aeruginosa TaxID=287 RepID=UPI00191BBD78|nr:ATP-binding protein [Pseudomonas aeruginosa]MCM3893084.1 ATP-binding protein [Pseudomonas aeruginosa]MCM3943988.1 ATP-binding protein [Pseudomonas aeruginosa]MCM3955993.1 ATP-binding protein [Pseudomonas aeruginosa]MCM3962036.1 ATP-binding protein [Pseudomonas aeruginosa]MCM3968080.1 ATP-binding protein [Pseudomonas aeruginosa]
MTVFVAGVHGVGKSYLCRKYASEHGVLHESASALINKERSSSSWGNDKRVRNVNENQFALKNAVDRIISDGSTLLLDGHFVLIGPECEFIYLPVFTFSDLHISAVVLVENSPSIVLDRLKARDSIGAVVDVTEFLKAERFQAELVCKNLDVPLFVLDAPDYDEFSCVIRPLLV